MSEKIGNRILRLKEVDSTNSYLTRNPELLRQHGLVVITNRQTAGRGRAGRSFISLPEQTGMSGANLTFSLVLHPELALGEVQILALLAGVAVARTLENYVSDIRLKWPNDVLVREKKICGILLETTTIPEQNFPVLVMGIGLNIKGSPENYPQHLRKIVTTLEFERTRNSGKKSGNGKKISLENEIVFQQLLEELERCLEGFLGGMSGAGDSGNFRKTEKQRGGRAVLLQEWLQRAQAAGRKVRSLNDAKEQTVEQGIVGTTVGLTREGYLQIRTETGEILTHISGDILDLEENHVRLAS